MTGIERCVAALFVLLVVGCSVHPVSDRWYDEGHRFAEGYMAIGATDEETDEACQRTHDRAEANTDMSDDDLFAYILGCKDAVRGKDRTDD